MIEDEIDNNLKPFMIDRKPTAFQKLEKEGSSGNKIAQVDASFEIAPEGEPDEEDEKIEESFNMFNQAPTEYP